MIVNVALLTSYAFEAVSFYIGFVLLVLLEFISDKYKIPRMILEVLVVATIIGSFINAYVTPRIIPQ